MVDYLGGVTVEAGCCTIVKRRIAQHHVKLYELGSTKYTDMASTGAPGDTIVAREAASSIPESRRSSTISISPEKEKTTGQAGSSSEKRRNDEEEIDEVDDEDDESSIEGIGMGERKGDNADVEKSEKLQKVASRASKASKFSVTNEGSIPNGGFRAWLQVLGAFFLFFNTWGIINTFGSYQAYYKTTLLPDVSPSAISWVGSIQAFLLLAVGALSGPIFDAGYFRELLLGGSILLVFGQMMLSLATKYWQVLLAQAFCIGIGTGGLFVPSVAILSTYFTTKIATAMGLAAAGSSIGGVLYPILFRNLVPAVGFPWATRILGFIILATQILPNTVMHCRVLPSKTRSLIDMTAFRNMPFVLDVLGFSIGFVGLYMPFFYAQLYAIDMDLTSEHLSLYLLAIMNSTSTFGRIVPNVLADRIGVFNVVIPCALISAVLCFCYNAAKDTAGMIVLMSFYGFFSGSFVSLPPTIIIVLSKDQRDKIGTRLGMNFTALAIGILIGTPIGGAILDAGGGGKLGYTGVWCFAGGCLVVSTIVLSCARGVYSGWKFWVKA